MNTMSPKPRVATPETELVRPITDAPRRRKRRTRRWRLIWTLLFAVGASLALWWGIFALGEAVLNARS